MKVLFLIFHGFDPNNGISKKISYQLDAFKANGHETHLCYMDESISKRRIVDNEVIVDYGNGKKGKVLKRTEFSSIVDYAIKSKIEFVYIRSNHNANPFTIHMVKRMKKEGHLVGNHTTTHPRLTDISVTKIKQELKHLLKELNFIIQKVLSHAVNHL